MPLASQTPAPFSCVTPARWAALCRSWGAAGGVAEGGYARLVDAWSTGARAYHGLAHLEACLREFDTARSLAQDAVAVETALWFHDAVYDSRAGDNEERSRDMALAFLQEAGAEPALMEQVARLILVTKTHEHDAAGLADGGLMVDVDLAILGQPRAEFQEYDRAIREEYAWVPAGIYEEKRREVLHRFLLRPRLYQTDFFFGQYEAKARANLSWRLDPTHSPPS